MLSDISLEQIEELKNIIDEFPCRPMRIDYLSGIEGNTDDHLKVLETKMLTYETLLSCKNKTPELEDEESFDELQEEMGKSVAYYKAWSSASIAKYILKCVTNEHKMQEWKLLCKRLDTLRVLQEEILKLNNEENLIDDTFEVECVELCKDLHHHKEYVLKMRSSRQKKQTDQEQKNFEKIRKINIMRKLINKILITFNFCDMKGSSEEEFEELMNILSLVRETVTLETFNE